MSESKRGDAMSTPSTMGADLCRLLLLLFWGIIDGMASGIYSWRDLFSFLLLPTSLPVLARRWQGVTECPIYI